MWRHVQTLYNIFRVAPQKHKRIHCTCNIMQQYRHVYVFDTDMLCCIMRSMRPNRKPRRWRRSWRVPDVGVLDVEFMQDNGYERYEGVRGVRSIEAPRYAEGAHRAHRCASKTTRAPKIPPHAAAPAAAPSTTYSGKVKVSERMFIMFDFGQRATGVRTPPAGRRRPFAPCPHLNACVRVRALRKPN